MKTHINIHHTATYAKNDADRQASSVNEGHKKRWNGETLSKLGFYGGYHYLIERDGSIFQFRGDEEVGAHNNISGMNQKALGVCFAGNMSEQDLTAAQVKAGHELITGLISKYKIPKANIKGHRAYKSTQCPGNKLGDDPWGYIKSQLNPAETPDWVAKAKRFAVESGISGGDRPMDLATRAEVWEMLRRFNNLKP